MKNHAVNRCAWAYLLAALLAHPAAAQEAEKASRFWQQHTQAKSDVMRRWKDADAAALNDAVFALSKAEIFLLAEGFVAPEDPRLVGRLAAAPSQEVRSRYDLPRFAHAVFLHELERQTGFRPRVETVLGGAVFAVRPRGGR